MVIAPNTAAVVTKIQAIGVAMGPKRLVDK